VSEATRRALRSLSRCALEQRIDALTQEVQDLRSLVQKLGHRIDELQSGSTAPPLVRAELRRDASNRAYFLTETLGLLRDHQDTATIGLVWWLGQKTGAW